MRTKNLEAAEKNSLLKNVLLGNLQNSDGDFHTINVIVDSLFGGKLNKEQTLDQLIKLFKLAFNSTLESRDFIFLFKYFHVNTSDLIKKIFTHQFLWMILESEFIMESLTPFFIDMINDRPNNKEANFFFTEYFYHHVYDRNFLESFHLKREVVIANKEKVIDWFLSIDLRKYRSGNIKDMLTKFPKEVFHTNHTKNLRRDFQIRLLENDFNGMHPYVISEDVSESEIRNIFFSAGKNYRNNNFSLDGIHVLETHIYPKKNMRSRLFKEIAGTSNRCYEIALRLNVTKNINELDIPYILGYTILTKQEFNNLMKLYEKDYNKSMSYGNTFSILEGYLYDIYNVLEYGRISEYRRVIFINLVLKKVKPLLVQGLRNGEVDLTTYFKSFSRNVSERLHSYDFKNPKYRAMMRSVLLKTLNGVYFKAIANSVSHYDYVSTINNFRNPTKESKEALSFLKTIDTRTDYTLSKNLIIELDKIKSN